MQLPEGKERIKLFVVIGVLILTTVWIGFYASSSFRGYGTAREPDSPSDLLVKDINTQLVGSVDFHDVGLSVTKQSPLALKAEGMVKTDAKLAELKTMLAEKVPSASIEYEVMIVP